MEAGSRLWQLGTLVVEPTGKGRGHAAEIKDSGGVARGTSADDGTIKDESGSVLLVAPLQKARSAGDVAIDVADAGGRTLGEVSVAGFTIAPRRRKVTLTIRDSSGSELARLEPRDKHGEQLSLAATGSDVATVRVEQVKSGFLRKSRVYTVDLLAEAPESLRPLAMAALIRYEAMLKEVEALSMRDD